MSPGSEWHLPRALPRSIWIEANVKGVDALRAASKTFADKLATLKRNSDAHLGAVVAFNGNFGAL